MGFTKRAYGTTKKVFIYGSGSILFLFMYMQAYLGVYGLQVTDWNGNQILQNLTCAGNQLEPCIWDIKLKSADWSFVFKSSISIYMNDSDGVNYTLKKRATDGSMRNFNMTGKTLSNESEWYLRITINKPADKTVKWGISGDSVGNLVLDPIAFGYSTDQIFPKLISSNADLTYGEAEFEIYNPTTIDFNKAWLGAIFNQVKGNITSYEYTEKVVTNVTNQAWLPNVTYNTTLQYDPINNTWINITTSVDNGKYINITEQAITYVNFTKLSPGKHIIKVRANWKASTGGIRIDWIPKLTISGTDFIQTRYVWGDASWAYKVNDTIGNATTPNVAQTNYQVLFVVDTATLISAGKMNSSCNDIRFTNNTESSTLPYWIESGCNTGTTRIWLKTSELAANTASIYYMYYGNPSAAASSYGGSVFPLFDNFDDASLNTSKWAYDYSAPTESGGYLKQSYAAAAYDFHAVQTFTVPYEIEFVGYMPTPDNSVLGVGNAYSTQWGLFSDLGYGGYPANIIRTSNSTGNNDTAYTFVDNRVYRYQMAAESNMVTALLNGTAYSSRNRYDSKTGFEINMGSSTNNIVWIDYAYVRTYLAIEPPVAYGTESSAPAGGVTVTLISPANNTWNNNATPSFAFNSTLPSNCSLQVNTGVSYQYYGNLAVSANTTSAIVSNTTMPGGDYYLWKVNCTSGSLANSTASRLIKIDTIAPAQVTGLVNSSMTNSSVYLNWSGGLDTDTNGLHDTHSDNIIGSPWVSYVVWPVGSDGAYADEVSYSYLRLQAGSGNGGAYSQAQMNGTLYFNSSRTASNPVTNITINQIYGLATACNAQSVYAFKVTLINSSKSGITAINMGCSEYSGGVANRDGGVMAFNLIFIKFNPNNTLDVYYNNGTLLSSASGQSTAGFGAFKIVYNVTASGTANGKDIEIHINETSVYVGYPSGVQKYIIYQNGTNIANTTNAYYNATGLSEYRWYGFNVSAIDNANNFGANSTQLTILTFDLTPPSAPVLTAVETKTDHVYMTWTVSTDYGSGLSTDAGKPYQVYRGGTLYYAQSGGYYSYNDTGVSLNDSLSYKIRVFDAVGNYIDSNTIAVTIPYFGIIVTLPINTTTYWVNASNLTGTGNFTPQNQTNAIPIFNITVQSNTNFTLYMKQNVWPNSCISAVWFDTQNTLNASRAINITTSWTIISSNINNTNILPLWSWAYFNNCTPGGYASNFTFAGQD